MVKPALLEWMNRDLDGDLTAAERQQLKRELEADAEARSEYDRLVLAASALRGLPRVAPPENLKSLVMAEIQRSRGRNRKRTYPLKYIMNRLAGWLGAGVSPRFLAGAAAGAAVVVVLSAVLGFYGNPSRFDVQGTLAPAGKPSIQVIGSYSLSAGRTSAEVHTIRHGSRVIVQLKINSPVGPRIQLGFDPGGLVLIGATHNGRPLADISPSAGLVTLSPVSDGLLQVVFDDQTGRFSTIHLSMSDNKVTTTRDLPTGGDVVRK